MEASCCFRLSDGVTIGEAREPDCPPPPLLLLLLLLLLPLLLAVCLIWEIHSDCLDTSVGHLQRFPPSAIVWGTPQTTLTVKRQEQWVDSTGSCGGCLLGSRTTAARWCVPRASNPPPGSVQVLSQQWRTVRSYQRTDGRFSAEPP